MLELAQHGSLTKKGRLQALSTTGPQGLDGHSLFPPSPGLQAAPANFSEGAWENRCSWGRVSRVGRGLMVSCPV